MKAALKLLIGMFLLMVVSSCSQEGNITGVSLELVTESKDLTVSAVDVPSVFEYRACSSLEQGEWTQLQSGQSSVNLDGFMPGYWTFEGRAYSSANVLLYEGSAGVTLMKGVQNSVTVSLRRTNISSSGTGTLSLSVRTPVSRDRASEMLQIKYRLAGTESYSSRLLTTGEMPQTGNLKTWATSLNSLPAGIYEVVVVLLEDSKEVLGRAFTADIRSGKTCTVSGTLDGGPDSTTYTIELQLADLITLAENENCTKVITGLTDSFTGQDITAAVIDKGGRYQLKYCSKSSISPTDSLSTFGIEPALYDLGSDPQANVLCSYEFLMITNDCTELPADDWFNTEYKGWDALPHVKTLYVNKNLTGDYVISGVVRLTRLIIGSDVTKITGDSAICDTNVLPLLSIPSSVTEVGTGSIKVMDGPSSMHIYCSLSSANAAKIMKSSAQTLHTDGTLPISQL